MLLRCWLRRVGCVSQYAYILHYVIYGQPLIGSDAELCDDVCGGVGDGGGGDVGGQLFARLRKLQFYTTPSNFSHFF